MDDSEYMDILFFLNQPKVYNKKGMWFPKQLENPTSKGNFAKRAANFVVNKSGLLMYQKDGIPSRIVVRKSEKHKILEEAHLISNHSGRDKMIFHISSRFYWKG